MNSTEDKMRLQFTEGFNGIKSRSCDLSCDKCGEFFKVLHTIEEEPNMNFIHVCLACHPNITVRKTNPNYKKRAFRA